MVMLTLCDTFSVGLSVSNWCRLKLSAVMVFATSISFLSTDFLSVFALSTISQEYILANSLIFSTVERSLFTISATT